jgi:hypothetical protein
MNKPLLRDSYHYREQDPDYRGEGLDPKYGDGPDSERSCTDILCLVLFVVLLGVLGYVAVVAFGRGDPRYLAYPFDSEGNQCYLDLGY